jgi:hypothetical protein
LELLITLLVAVEDQVTQTVVVTVVQVEVAAVLLVQHLVA